MSATDPRLIEVRGLRRAGGYVGLGPERIRQLARNDPYFPKPTLRGRRSSWSAAQLDAYKALRATRQLHREQSRARIDEFKAAEAEGSAGDDLSKHRVTDDGLYSIDRSWRIFFRRRQIATVLDTLIDARITLEHLRRQDLSFEPSTEDQDELVRFLAAEVPDSQTPPGWMWDRVGRVGGEGLPLTGATDDPWGVVWLPEMVEVFAARMRGVSRELENTILLSDLPADVDRATADRLFREMCSSPVAQDPRVSLLFLRKALAICFPREGESANRAAYVDRAADIAWLPFDPSTVPVTSEETDWGLIDFAAGPSGEVSELPRSIEVWNASGRLPETVLAGIPTVRAAVG